MRRAAKTVLNGYATVVSLRVGKNVSSRPASRPPSKTGRMDPPRLSIRPASAPGTGSYCGLVRSMRALTTSVEIVRPNVPLTLNSDLCAIASNSHVEL
jgi:hypothetical protein